MFSIDKRTMSIPCDSFAPDSGGGGLGNSKIAEKSSCDTNNNNPTSTTFRGKRLLSKTYGLRPRSTLRRLLIDPDICELKTNNIIPKNTKSSAIAGDKHAPLSKYRRKTANARERLRMKEINDAFSTLRKVLPPIHTRRTILSSMTKITTLRLAVAYIRALSEILDENGPTPSETTKTLLTAANVRLWNENTTNQTQPSQQPSSTCAMQNQFHPPVPENNNCQIIPKTEVPMPDCMTFESIIPQNTMKECPDERKPCREDGFMVEKSSINNFNVNDCELDDNSSFWDDIPLLNDFQWSLA